MGRIADYKMNLVDFNRGSTTTDGLSDMSKHLEDIKKHVFETTNTSTSKLSLYHTQLSIRSMEGLKDFSFKNVNSNNLNIKLLEIRRDLFWHRWYIHEKVNKVQGDHFRIWCGLNNMWENEKSIIQYYNDISVLYYDLLKLSFSINKIKQYLLAPVIIATPLLMQHELSIILEGLLNNLNIQVKIDHNNKLYLLLLNTIGSLINSFRNLNKLKLSEDEQLQNIKRQMDCFRIFDKMYYFTYLSSCVDSNQLGKNLGIDDCDMITFKNKPDAINVEELWLKQKNDST